MKSKNVKITVRLTEEVISWLRDTSKLTGLPMAELVRDQLESARLRGGKQRFLRHLGSIKGLPRDLSPRKGFSKE